jgi:DNA-directed RNA polymerase subunit M/transcription elongation factor TFIIS
MLMFKNVIAPIQAWLLSQGKCVGCGSLLESGKHEKHKYGEKVTCSKCGRIYILSGDPKKYRRALLEEV